MKSNAMESQTNAHVSEDGARRTRTKRKMPLEICKFERGIQQNGKEIRGRRSRTDVAETQHKSDGARKIDKTKVAK